MFVGVAGAAAVMVYIPSAGSPPSIYDDFMWSTAANGFWHVNAVGGTARIGHDILRLSGASVELDRRIQTDPYQTVVAARVRGVQFHKFQVGLGQYHSGTVSIEFDDDGAKCGRGTDFGWKVDYIKPWSKPPVGQWYYTMIGVINPFPDAKKEPSFDLQKKHPVTVWCALYDSKFNLVAYSVPHSPPPNAHYAGLDEAFVRTWDHANNYVVDWFYAGPESGNPIADSIRLPPTHAWVSHARFPK
jgi:hypothetical protein